MRIWSPRNALCGCIQKRRLSRLVAVGVTVNMTMLLGQMLMSLLARGGDHGIPNSKRYGNTISDADFKRAAFISRISPGVESIVRQQSLPEIHNFQRSNNDAKQEFADNDQKVKIIKEISGRKDKAPRLPEVSAVVSIRKFTSGAVAMEYFLKILKYLPSNLVTDIVVIIDMNIPEKAREFIEDSIDDSCNICRMIVLNGTYYQLVNFVVPIIRSYYVVFIDCRVQLTDFWLEPMVAKMLSQNNKNLVISPNIRLSNGNGSEISSGVYQNEITWDLGVVRGAHVPKGEDDNSYFHDQTAISKEVFLIERHFFENIFLFDIVTYTSGLENTALSLKILNCGGNILQSRLSIVIMSLPDDTLLTESLMRVQPDTINPTFIVHERDIMGYMVMVSRLWFDVGAFEFFRCSVKGRNVPGRDGKPNRHPVWMTSAFKKTSKVIRDHLRDEHCELGRFWQLLQQRQPTIQTPVVNTTFYGYIRSLDGMYAVGVANQLSFDTYANDYKKLNSDEIKVITSQNLVMTRNSSLWLSSFSYVNRTVIFKKNFCVTLNFDNSLKLSKCSLDKQHEQQFGFVSNSLRLLSDDEQCVGFRSSSEVSPSLVLTHCDDVDAVTKIKFDVQFLEKCIKHNSF